VTLARDQIRILQIAEGYFGSHVLFALNELDVCAALAEGPAQAEELAARLEVDADALERVLRAGVTMDLLLHSAEGFSNSELARNILVRGEPGYLGNWLRLMSRWSRNWTRLTEAVQSGVGVAEPDGHLGSDPAATRDFILAMDDYARLRGSEVARYVDLEGVETLLDVGGGPGTYSILFARKWPDLEATVFDLPGVVEIAAEIAEEAGLSERVRTQAGDYLEDPFGGPYDVIFISGTLHQEDPETCRMLLRKAFDALGPGGRIVVQGMFLNEDKMGPRWPVMQSLSLLLLHGKGRAYSAAETMEMAESAGFADVSHRKMSMMNVNSLIVGRRP
jgi:hypothetical protein